MDRTIWRSPNTAEMVSEYKCPHCDKGWLKIQKSHLIIKEYKYSRKNHKHPDMESCWVESTCSGIMECNHEHCQEFVSFCGDARGDDVEVQDDKIPGGWGIEYIDKINIKYIYPSPNLIPLNKKYPETIQKLMKESFCLYWSNPSSCANKLRIIVEEIVNDLKIPKKHKAKKDRKLTPSTLHHRLTRLADKKGYTEAADYLLAIKEIGNPASHSKDFKEEAIIPAYMLIDKALDLIYVGSDKKLKEIKKLARNKKLA